MLRKALVICNNHVYIYIDENEVVLNLRIILSSERHFISSKVLREVLRKQFRPEMEGCKNFTEKCTHVSWILNCLGCDYLEGRACVLFISEVIAT